MADVVVEVIQQTVISVDNNIINVISEGIQGPPGTGGTGSDLHYTHDQMVASATWNIVHNLNKYPSVAVVDSAGSEVEGSVMYVTPNRVIVEFSAAFGGKAYLN